LRERGEDLAKEELAGALSRRSSCEARLREAGETLASARDQQRDLVAAPASAADLIARQLFLERAERDRHANQQDLARHDSEVAQRRAALVEAARDRQALERLKERQRLDHARELARVEGNTLDEIALTVHRRRAS
jgi:flagellar FliJ protein